MSSLKTTWKVFYQHLESVALFNTVAPLLMCLWSKRVLKWSSLTILLSSLRMIPTIRIPELFWSSKISKMMNHMLEVLVFQDLFSLMDSSTLLIRCGSLCLMTKVTTSMTEQWVSMMTKTQESWWSSQSPNQLLHHPQFQRVLHREDLNKKPWTLILQRRPATWTQSETQRIRRRPQLLHPRHHREPHLQ